jgi:hypothetical protein
MMRFVGTFVMAILLIAVCQAQEETRKGGAAGIAISDQKPPQTGEHAYDNLKEPLRSQHIADWQDRIKELEAQIEVIRKAIVEDKNKVYIAKKGGDSSDLAEAKRSLGKHNQDIAREKARMEILKVNNPPFTKQEYEKQLKVEKAAAERDKAATAAAEFIRRGTATPEKRTSFKDGGYGLWQEPTRSFELPARIIGFDEYKAKNPDEGMVEPVITVLMQRERDGELLILELDRFHANNQKELLECRKSGKFPELSKLSTKQLLALKEAARKSWK